MTEIQDTKDGVADNGSVSVHLSEKEANVRYTTKQWLTLFTLAFGCFCNGACVALQAPFFPKEAEKKGATATEYGLIFGIFSLTIFLTAPIIGKLVSYINPKYLLDVGFFTVAVSLVLFGTLDMVEDSKTFVALAFVIRTVEGLGTATWKTACYTIIASQFPEAIARTFAILQVCNGVGMIAGPTLGGALYDLGGYGLPFYFVGGLIFIDTAIIYFVLPVIEKPKLPDKGNFLKFLLLPSTFIYALSIFTANNFVQFNGATLEPHIREFHLSGSMVGLLFGLYGTMYAVSAPFFGWLMDKKCGSITITLFGSLCFVVSVLMIGPAPFFAAKINLALVIAALALLGLSMASKIGSAFTGSLESTINSGFPSDVTTYGLVSSMVASSQSLGAFAGPSIGGYLVDEFGYRNASMSLLILETLLITLLLLSIFRNKICRSTTSISLVEDPVVLMGNDHMQFEKYLANDSIKQNYI